MFATVADAPKGAVGCSALEIAGTEDSSAVRTRCSVLMVARPCVSTPTLGSVIADLVHD